MRPIQLAVTSVAAIAAFPFFSLTLNSLSSYYPSLTFGDNATLASAVVQGKNSLSVFREETQQQQQQNQAEEYPHFDPSKVKTVYRIIGRRYGRTNNKLISILHAIDKGLDDHNETIGEFVVALSDWSSQLMEDFFFHPKSAQSWGPKLEELSPVVLVHADRLEALGLTAENNVTIEEIWSKNAYWYGAYEWTRHSVAQQEKRRRMVLMLFFQQVGLAKQNFEVYNALRQYFDETLGGKENERNGRPPKYAAIHSRWLEGSCERRLGDKIPQDECLMSPQYIKEILGTPIEMPVVFVSDGQNKDIPKSLLEDTDIGPHLIMAEDLPGLDKDKQVSQPVNDMVVAINSEIFIGTRVSTMALIIAQVRVILGEDPKSNFVYTWRTNKPATEENTSSLQVCEDCLWLCNATRSDLCGNEMLYP